MSDRSFYIPGLSAKQKEQWNKTTPSFRILARRDLYPLTHEVRNCNLQPAAETHYFVPPVPRFMPAPFQPHFGGHFLPIGHRT